MFDAGFIADLEQINTNRSKRETIAQFLTSKNEAIPQMLLFAEENPQLFAKAMRSVEIIAREQPNLLFPHINLLLKLAQMAKTDAQIRPIGKIIESVTEYFFKTEKAKLNESQINIIVQICFDWLITEQKTAAKAYSMSVLFLFSTKISWIKTELKQILQQNMATETAGYKARARMILKKMR